MQHRAGAEKQQRLEQAVIPDVQQSARERQPPPGRIPLLHRHEREAKPDENDPDVLDAVIGEQALEVVLPKREGDAEHGADHTEHATTASPHRSAPAASR